MRKLFLLPLLLLPFSVQADDKIQIITVHGEATTKTAPDQVSLPVTIREENTAVSEAKAAHDKKLSALLRLAENTGIARDDIQTGYTAINPLYDYNQGNKPKLRGYEAQTTVEF